MDVRRRFAALRRPRLLAAGLVLVGTYLFATNLTPWPRYVVRTEAKLDLKQGIRPEGSWGSVQHVSDDGRHVIVGIHEGNFSGYVTRLEFWDARTGTDQTPAHWKDPDWTQLLTDGANGTPTGLADLHADPSGRELLHDGAAWAGLWERLAWYKGEHGRFGRDHLRFSPDGRLIAVVAKDGWPAHLAAELGGDGTVIEDARTGRRVARLPGVTFGIEIAPGGRTAVSRNIPAVREGEQPYLTLWDLETSSRRAELLLPDGYPRFGYTPDGRYVFATCTSPSMVRWWDAATGRPVGEITGPAYRRFPDGDRLLTQAVNDDTLVFWDLLTSRRLGEWEPDRHADGSRRIGTALSFGGGRYLVAEFDDHPDPKSGQSFPLMDRLIDRLPDGPPTDGTRVVLLDVIDRRVSGPVPGRVAALSADGRWLATLDADGVVRVWAVPLGRPWVRGLVYAAAVVLGGWGAWRLVGRVRRRL